MSDLPPSTIPPEDDQPLSQRSEEEQITDENKKEDEDIKDENKDKEKDEISEKAELSEHEVDNKDDIDEEVKSEAPESEPETDVGEKEQEQIEDDKETEVEKDKSDTEEDRETKEENKEKVEEGNEEKEDTEPEKIPDNNEENDIEKDEKQHQSDTDMHVIDKVKHEPEPDGDNTKPEDHEQTRKDEERDSQEESDVEEEALRRKDKNDYSDEDEIQRKRIGGKKGKEYLTKGALTTVLVSREEEERNRQKLQGKTKKQKMRKMAKKKTRRFGGKGDKDNRHGMDGDGYGSSDEDTRRRGLREAPFMKQYEDKKHIEHILDEQHYWSDPEADKEAFRINDDMSSIFRSDSSSESEEEIIGIDADGNPIRRRVKKTKRDKRKKHGDGDDISNADSEYLRQKMLKRAGSVDSMVSVEDPDKIDQRKSKRRLNEHVMRTDSDEDISARKSKKNTSDEMKEEQEGTEDKDEKKDKDEKNKNDSCANTKFGFSKTKTIIVKEHSDMTDDSVNGDDRKTRKQRRALGGKESYNFDGFSDSDIENFSDRDSGMDEEEGDVDVFLTPDQQQMIVNMLFDEEMNLRPQFTRDGNGRIVRRLDNTVVYDPHTGRFTYRKRLGQIFKVPRLKRNDKGRPLGGYIDDEFGPKSDTVTVRRKTSSARKSQSGKSGRTLDTRSSSADLKRTRTDGKNVGFSVPDEEINTLPEDQLEINKRGRRDIGSAIRRTLNKRLFRKKRKLGRGSSGVLPEIKTKKAWGDDQLHVPGAGSVGGQGGISPLNPRSGRFAQSSPWLQRRTPGPGDAEQWQVYREGLQSDRRILENLQDKLNSRDGPFAPREAFVEPGEEGDHADQGEGHYSHETGYGNERGYSYMTDDGRLVIRERGCPELKQQKTPLFTIVRRPGDLESQEHLNDVPASQRQTKSAPIHVQDYQEELTENEQRNEHRYTSENSLVTQSHDGRSSQMTSIDDNRLRRLLEELYKDKKYFDHYVESQDPKSEEFEYSQGLALHGRGYLLKRADYWERRGPLPPRPPMTAIGWKMQRQQTLFASRQTSELGASTTTCTPDLSTTNMPGMIESPRNEPILEENDLQNSQNESYV